MFAPEITTASLSDVGRVRTRNEDSYGEFVHPAGYRLLVVADGMGGHRAGATASQAAVAAIGEVFADFDESPDSMLRRAIEAANERVHSMAVEHDELRGMGTTAVALLLGPGQLGWVAHVGDSRAYRLRADRLEALTRDHSVVAELERRGLLTADEAAVHPRRNEILRCVGIHPEVDVEISEIEVDPGDLFLLCSDGLSGMVDEVDIANIVESRPPAEAAQVLVELANEAGGNDNVTVQIAHVPASTSEGSPVSPVDQRAAEAGAEPPLQLEREHRQRRAVVVTAVLIAGLAALTLLWQIYSFSSG